MKSFRKIEVEVHPLCMSEKQSTQIFAGDVNGQQLVFTIERIVGKGSFGVVYKCTGPNGDIVAVKKVLQDPRFKNRELSIMRLLFHPNIIRLQYYFYSTEEHDRVFLNLVTEFMPETVYRVARHYASRKQTIPQLYIKIYAYQLIRALHYIHTLGICHRDIKPQNLLLNSSTGILKVCDLGSAKMLVEGERNVAYICSRYYRAPELIFGASLYSTAIDVWSYGCVLAELLLGQPIFPGGTSVDQLVEIIKVLGTPSKAEISDMNPHYTDFRFPNIEPHPWSKVFRKNTDPLAIDLISKLLVYSPKARLTPAQVLCHPYFDELRDSNTRLPNTTARPNGHPLPPLFNWTKAELGPLKNRPEILAKLIPPAHWNSESMPPLTELGILTVYPKHPGDLIKKGTSAPEEEEDNSTASTSTLTKS